jgi:hypothetical protein
MPAPKQLTRGQALAFGAVFAAAGVFPVLIGLGVLHPSSTHGDHTAPWVIVCTGLVFIFAGCSIIVSFGSGARIAANGQFDPATPRRIQIAQFVLMIALLAALTSVFGWVGFGPGPRQFSTTLTLPFATSHAQGSSTSGRVVFGIAAIGMGLMTTFAAISGTKRLILRAPARNS